MNPEADKLIDIVKATHRETGEEYIIGHLDSDGNVEITCTPDSVAMQLVREALQTGVFAPIDDDALDAYNEDRKKP